MAVLQIAFKHHNPLYEQRSNRPCEGFTSQLRRLVIAEANEWRSNEDIVLDWGDPAYSLDAPALVKASRQGEARSVFGRSWIHYHRPSHAITLAVDKLGLFPILLFQQENTTYLASDALAMSQLSDAASIPAEQALIDLLAYGQLLGAQATLRGVTHLHAASVCTINASGAYQLIHESPISLSGDPCSEQEALDALLAAVDRRFRHGPEVLISLSGGLDSRLLLAAARAAGHRPVTFSVAYAGSPQQEIARNLANVAGTEYFCSEVTPQQFARSLPLVAQLGGGEVPLHHLHALVCPELIARTRGSTLMTNIGAQTFHGCYYDRGMPGSEIFGIARLKSKLLKTARNYVTQAFGETLTPFISAFPEMSAYLQERLSMRLDVYQAQAADAAHYLDSVYLGERVRRFEVACQQLLARDYARTHPLLDEDVVRCLAGLPVSLRLTGRFHRRAIEKLNAKLADVPWDKTMRPLKQGLRWDERYPELAAHLGMHNNPKIYTAPLPGDNGWLNRFAEETAPLRFALKTSYGLPEERIMKGIQSLLTGPNRAHILCVLGTYDAWTQHLATRHTALAA
ncbi:MAG: hypothetical protein GY862_16375 [Gammaproteobacteria bacterium]|nr:hypothetical protein [Gammaproteobacteria bacterium]